MINLEKRIIRLQKDKIHLEGIENQILGPTVTKNNYRDPIMIEKVASVYRIKEGVKKELNDLVPLLRLLEGTGVDLLP